jgi:alpha-galactosidase
MVFTRNLVMDLLHFEHFRDAELCLMDIDEKRLAYAEKCVEKVVRTMQVPAHITTTTDRRRVLEGADGVVCTVFNGDTDISKLEVDIPYQFGVSMNIGDTRSVGGIFRALRNIPLMLDICRDIESLCPNALFLNYTNPMGMLCKAMQTYSRVNVTGLCHSVQHTAQMLADWIGAPSHEIDYLCAGVNHQAFYLHYRWNGRDAYPLLREKLCDPAIYNEEQVRNEMFLQLGYYVTESSGHNSEYCPWFRKRPDLLEQYCTHGTGWNPGLHAYSINKRIARDKTLYEDIDRWLEEPLEIRQSGEYAANIFDACFGSETPFQFNGNVLNDGCIENLPKDACVEIPVLATRDGLRKMHVGSLPAHLAILVGTTARIESLVVEGCMNKDREAIIHAVQMDPLCAAVCSLQEIREMCGLLFEKEQDYIGF